MHNTTIRPLSSDSFFCLAGAVMKAVYHHEIVWSTAVIGVPDPCQIVQGTTGRSGNQPAARHASARLDRRSAQGGPYLRLPKLMAQALS